MLSVGRAVCHGRVAAGDDDLLGAVDSLLGSWYGHSCNSWCTSGLDLDLSVTNLVGN